jgi:hypothetical protein
MLCVSVSVRASWDFATKHNDTATAEHPSHELRLSNGLTWGFSWATAGRQMNDRARTAQEDEMAR